MKKTRKVLAYFFTVAAALFLVSGPLLSWWIVSGGYDLSSGHKIGYLLVGYILAGVCAMIASLLYPWEDSMW